MIKTDNVIDNWSKDFVIHDSQTQYVFIRLHSLDWNKANYVDVFSLVSTIRAMKLKVKTIATTFTKIPFPQFNCNVKETLLRVYEKEQNVYDAAKKRHSSPR